MPNANAYFEIADARLTFLRQQALEILNASKLYSESADRFGALLHRTWRELIGYLLPEVDTATLTALQKRLGYPGLLPIRVDFQTKLRAAVERKLELERLDEVAHRAIVEAPLQDQLSEIDEPHQAMKNSVEWWQDNLRHADLTSRGYFGPRPDTGIVARPQNWRTASFLMRDAERHFNVRFERAAAMRDHYISLLGDFEPLAELKTELERQLEHITALNDEHAALTRAPVEMGQDLYRRLGEALRDHVESAPTEALYDAATGDEHFIMFLKKLKGLEKQERYLRELRVTRIKSLQASVAQQISKLERKVRKRRNKHWRGKFNHVSQSEYDGLANFKADKWAKRHTRLTKLRTRIDDFDRYDDGSFGDHFLWWDVMTKRAPADDLYEVKTYRERYGDFAEDHPHALLESALGEWAAEDESLMAEAADSMADDMMSGSDHWSADAS